MPKTVGVAVSNATFHFDKLYTYAVMPDQQEAVRLGSMVLVPFGRGSKARMGVVLACDEEPEHAKLKYLFDVAPASACLTPELLRLVHFLKERTFCTYYEAVKAVIPATPSTAISWWEHFSRSPGPRPSSWRQWPC